MSRAASFVVNHAGASLARSSPVFTDQEVSVGGQTFTRHTKIDIPLVAKVAASPAEQATIDKINAQLRTAALREPGQLSDLAMTPVVVGVSPRGQIPWELQVQQESSNLLTVITSQVRSIKQHGKACNCRCWDKTKMYCIHMRCLE